MTTVPEKKTIQLEFPICVDREGGQKIVVNEVSLGRLKTKHLKLLPPDFSEKDGIIEPVALIPLIAALTDLDVSLVEEIDIVDLMKISGEFNVFFGQKKSQRIGRKPSG